MSHSTVCTTQVSTCIPCCYEPFHCVHYTSQHIPYLAVMGHSTVCTPQVSTCIPCCYEPFHCVHSTSQHIPYLAVMSHSTVCTPQVSTYHTLLLWAIPLCALHKSAHTIPCCHEPFHCVHYTSQHIPYLAVMSHSTVCTPQVSTYHTLLLWAIPLCALHKSAHTIPCCHEPFHCVHYTSQHIPYLAVMSHSTVCTPQVSTYHTLLL